MFSFFSPLLFMSNVTRASLTENGNLGAKGDGHLRGALGVGVDFSKFDCACGVSLPSCEPPSWSGSQLVEEL